MAPSDLLEAAPDDALARRAALWCKNAPVDLLAKLKERLLEKTGFPNPYRVHTLGSTQPDDYDAQRVLYVDGAGDLYHGAPPTHVAWLGLLGPPSERADPGALAPLLVHVVLNTRAHARVERSLLNLLVAPQAEPSAGGPGLAVRLHHVSHPPCIRRVHPEREDWTLDAGRSVVLWMCPTPPPDELRRALGDEGVLHLPPIPSADPTRGVVHALAMAILRRSARASGYEQPPELHMEIVFDDSMEASERWVAHMEAHLAQGSPVIRWASHPPPDVLLWVQEDGESPPHDVRERLEAAHRADLPILVVQIGRPDRDYNTLLETGIQRISGASPSPEAVIDAVLLSWLRRWSVEGALRRLRRGAALPPAIEVLSRAPSPLRPDGGEERPRFVVYPDPPLLPLDDELMRLARPSLRSATPTTLLAWGLRGALELPKEHHPVAISYTEATDELGNPSPDRGSGLRDRHALDAVSHVARSLLAAGFRLSYDGTLHLGGPPSGGKASKSRVQATYHLGSAIRSWSRAYSRQPHTLVCHVPYTDPKDARRPRGVTVIRLEAPPDAPAGPPWTDEDLRLARLDVRLHQVFHTCGRFVTGGRIPARKGYTGLSGVLEEVWCSLSNKNGPSPIYVAGGFGGAAGLVADLLRRRGARQIPDTPQAGLPTAESLHTLLNELGARLGWHDDAEHNGEHDDLSRAYNGLSVAENRRLLASTDPMEIAALVLRGLTNIASPRRPTGALPTYELLEGGLQAATNVDLWLMDLDDDGSKELLPWLGVPNVPLPGVGVLYAEANRGSMPIVYLHAKPGTSRSTAEALVDEVLRLQARSAAIEHDLWERLGREGQLARLEGILHHITLICDAQTESAHLRLAVLKRHPEGAIRLTERRARMPAAPETVHLKRQKQKLLVTQLGGPRALATTRRLTPPTTRTPIKADSEVVWSAGQALWRALQLNEALAADTDVPLTFALEKVDESLPLEAMRADSGASDIVAILDPTPPPVISLRRPVIRQLLHEARREARPPDHRLRVLLFGLADQEGLPPAERALRRILGRQIADVHKLLKKFGSADIHDVSNQPEDLLRELSSGQWDVVHLTTHGTVDGSLLLRGDPYGDDALFLHAADLRPCEHSPGFVFFNACFGATMAGQRAVWENARPPRAGGERQVTLALLYAELGCQAVLGPIQPVNEHFAHLMAVEVYQQLVQGAPLEIAVLQARRAMARSSKHPEWPFYAQYGGAGLTLRSLANIG
jgi:hypothetical protein